MFQTTGIIVAMLSLFIGWLALWPARHHLGVWGYHLAAFPVGLLSWTIVAVSSSTLERPLDFTSATLGIIAFVLVLHAVSRYSIRDAESPTGTTSARSYAITALVLALAAGILVAARLTIATPDSWGSYWPMAMQLAREGVMTTGMISTRGISLIAISAPGAALGGDWAYIIYPLMGMTVLGLLVAVLTSGPFAAFGRRAGVAVAVVLVFFAATNQTFIYHSLYVHSHMISALYLLLAMVGLWMASDYAPARGLLLRSDAWLVVAGVSAAGLALARPDGLAHVFLPVAVAISVLTTRERGTRSDLAFFAPLFFIVWSVYLVLFVQNGLWDSAKLGGRMALGLTALLAVAALAPSVIRRTRASFNLSGERFLIAVLGAGALLMAAASVVRWDTVRLALAHTYLNLLGGEGGWGHLWWGFAALLLLSLATGDAVRPNSWGRTLFLTIVLYFLALGLIHGITAPGRIGAGATLNRVAFHIVPVLIWYIGVVTSSVLGDWQRLRANAPVSLAPTD